MKKLEPRYSEFHQNTRQESGRSGIDLIALQHTAETARFIPSPTGEQLRSGNDQKNTRNGRNS